MSDMQQVQRRMQLYFTTLTNNKRYVEYKAKVIKQGDRSSQSSGLGEWSTEHGDGAFPGWCDFFLSKDKTIRSRRVRSQQVNSNPWEQIGRSLGRQESLKS